MELLSLHENFSYSSLILLFSYMSKGCSAPPLLFHYPERTCGLFRFNLQNELVYVQGFSGRNRRGQGSVDASLPIECFFQPRSWETKSCQVQARWHIPPRSVEYGCEGAFCWVDSIQDAKELMSQNPLWSHYYPMKHANSKGSLRFILRIGRFIY